MKDFGILRDKDSTRDALRSFEVPSPLQLITVTVSFEVPSPPAINDSKCYVTDKIQAQKESVRFKQDLQNILSLNQDARYNCKLLNIMPFHVS